MLEKKNYMLNCDVCDARKINEDMFDCYDKVMINADLLLINEKSKEILNKYPIQLNVDDTILTEEEVNISTCNGKYQIKRGQEISKSTILIINGELIIEAGTEEILNKYIRIIVNGSVKYPQSVAPYLTNIIINGDSECYPDDCIMLKSVTIIDKYFALRAKIGAKYYISKKVILADSSLNISALINKNIKFITPKLIIIEDKLEDAINLFSDDVEIAVIPNGCSFIDSDVVLDENIIRKYGTKLFINGNLSFKDTNLLGKIEYLNVDGNVNLLKKQVNDFKVIDSIYKEISIVKGKTIKNKISITIDRNLLETVEDGILLKNCAKVLIKPEISGQEIIDLFEIENCAKIICSAEQKSAIEMISTNVAKICEKDDLEDKDDLTRINNFFGNKVINADNYIL